MFGADSYGSVPFGASGSTPFDYSAMLASSREELIFTMVLTVYDAGSGETTIHLASSEWATSPVDIPASTSFDGRLTTALSFSRSVVDSDRLGINFTSGTGQISFANSDGEFDTAFDDYALGRRVVVRVGRKSDAFANHMVIFDGIATDWSADEDTITLSIQDKGSKLAVPASPNVYAGTGGAEGGSDQTGKRKPLCFGGFVFGVPPTLINSTLQIYQVNDGAVDQINDVFDRGVVLTSGADYADYAALAAAAPAAGTYVTCIAEGLFRLGAAADGVVFATVVRAPSYTQDIVEHLLLDTAGLSVDEVDYGSFDALAISYPSVNICHFVGADDGSSVHDLIAALMAGVSGWGGFERDGKFAIGRLVAPSGDPVAYFDRDEGDIIDLAREKLPDGVWPPPWRWRVAWKRSFTTFSDFAGSVSAGDRALYSEPYRLAPAESAPVLVSYPQAIDHSPVEAYFLVETDASDEADRLLALYTGDYRLWRVTVPIRGLLVKMGAVIHVTHPRFGLSGGRLMRVVGIEDKIEVGDGSGVPKVEIVVFG